MRRYLRNTLSKLATDTFLRQGGGEGAFFLDCLPSWRTMMATRRGRISTVLNTAAKRSSRFVCVASHQSAIIVDEPETDQNIYPAEPREA